MFGTVLNTIYVLNTFCYEYFDSSFFIVFYKFAKVLLKLYYGCNNKFIFNF